MSQIFFSQPQTIGLMLDLIGCFYIVRSFIFKKPKKLLRECQGDYNGMSIDLFKSFYKQGIEARVGFFVITVSFSFQVIGVIFPDFSLSIYVGISIILGIFFISCLFHKILCRERRLTDMVDRIIKK